MKGGKAYDEQAKSLQRRAGIRTNEEMAGYKAGVEMQERAQKVYGYEQITNALNSIKTAQDTINSLVQDQKFNSKHKQKFSVYSKQLNDIQAALTNVAASGAQPKQADKTLEP